MKVSEYIKLAKGFFPSITVFSDTPKDHMWISKKTDKWRKYEGTDVMVRATQVEGVNVAGLDVIAITADGVTVRIKGL
jgi:hypothetical protein